MPGVTSTKTTNTTELGKHGTGKEEKHPEAKDNFDYKQTGILHDER